MNALRTAIGSFKADGRACERSLALAAASVTVGEEALVSLGFDLAARHDNDPSRIYELVLQSYLFLGFPRMLAAAYVFAEQFPGFKRDAGTGPISNVEAKAWYESGISLCRQIYGDSFDRLQSRVTDIAPEVFRWMIVEGYGKVLSREALPIVDRELCIIAFLMMENRPKQLHSHIHGAINVGAGKSVIRAVVTDIGDAAGAGYRSAEELLSKLM